MRKQSSTLNIHYPNSSHADFALGVSIRGQHMGDGSPLNEDFLVPINKVPIETRTPNEVDELPKQNKLYQNYPNPWQSQTTIEFNFEKTSNAELVLYNLLGQLVKKFQYRNVSGFQKATLDHHDLSSGTYLYYLVVDGKVVEKAKMMMVVK